MRIEIDHETCLLSGKCIFFHPDLFAEREDGHPRLLHEEITPEQRETALDAIDACPTSSIALVEEAASAGQAGG